MWLWLSIQLLQLSLCLSQCKNKSAFFGWFLILPFHSTQMLSWTWPNSLFQRKSSLQFQSLHLFFISFTGFLTLAFSFQICVWIWATFIFPSIGTLIVIMFVVYSVWIQFKFLCFEWPEFGVSEFFHSLFGWWESIHRWETSLNEIHLGCEVMPVYKHSLYMSLFIFESINRLYRLGLSKVVKIHKTFAFPNNCQHCIFQPTSPPLCIRITIYAFDPSWNFYNGSLDFF